MRARQAQTAAKLDAAEDREADLQEKVEALEAELAALRELEKERANKQSAIIASMEVHADQLGTAWLAQARASVSPARPTFSWTPVRSRSNGKGLTTNCSATQKARMQC